MTPLLLWSVWRAVGPHFHDGVDLDDAALLKAAAAAIRATVRHPKRRMRQEGEPHLNIMWDPPRIAVSWTDPEPWQGKPDLAGPELLPYLRRIITLSDPPPLPPRPAPVGQMTLF